MDLKACNTACFFIFKSTACQLLCRNKSSLRDDQRDISIEQDNKRGPFDMCGVSVIFSVASSPTAFSFKIFYVQFFKANPTFITQFPLGHLYKPPETKPCCNEAIPLLFWKKKQTNSSSPLAMLCLQKLPS